MRLWNAATIRERFKNSLNEDAFRQQLPGVMVCAAQIFSLRTGRYIIKQLGMFVSSLAFPISVRTYKCTFSLSGSIAKVLLQLSTRSMVQRLCFVSLTSGPDLFKGSADSMLLPKMSTLSQLYIEESFYFLLHLPAFSMMKVLHT